MVNRLDGAAAQEWRASWAVVMAAMMGMAISTSYIYSIGIMIEPLEAEYGWSRAEISSGPTIAAFFAVTLSPFVGRAIDRLGPRRIGLFGSIAFCAALALLSAATPNIWSWWGLWVILALAAPFVKATVWTAAVSSLFNKSRGMALAIVLCGTGIGSSLVPLSTVYLTDSYSWRVGYIGLGGLCALSTIPLLFLFFTSDTDRRRVRGLASAPGEAPKPKALTGVPMREALLSPTFVKLALAAFLTTVISMGTAANLVPILSEGGLPRDTAAWIAAASGICAIAGRLAGGVLLDRIDGNLVAGGCLTLSVLSYLLLVMFPGSAMIALAAVILLGVSLGVEFDAVAYLVGRHFGLLNFGVLFGTIAGLLALAGGTAPLITNFVYDQTQSYAPVLWSFVPASLFCAALFFSVGRNPAQDAEDQPAAAINARISSAGTEQGAA